MGGFFLFILILIFALFLLGRTILRALVQFFFKKTAYSFTNQQQTYGNRRKQSQYTSNDKRDNRQNRSHQKVFSKNEGEYVDFEEVKQ